MMPHPVNHDHLMGVPFLSWFPERIIGSQHSYFLFTVLTLLLVLIIGFYLVRMEINYLIIPNRSQFAALFYVAISAFAFKTELFSGAIIASLFLLIAIDRTFRSFEKKKLSFRFLDAGILLSLGSLFYFNILFLLPFFWLVQVTLRGTFRKELLFTVIGSMLPFVYIFAGYFLFDRSIPDMLASLRNYLFTKNSGEHSLIFIAGISFYLIIILISSFYAIQKFGKIKVQVRKLYQLLLYLFLNILVIYLLMPSAGDEVFLLMSIPLGSLLSIYYAECKNGLINNILFLLLIGIPIAINFLN
jgi:hypothetical protein